MQTEQDSMQDDMESMMDEVAMECMNAVESKDKESFRNSFHVLVSDIVDKLSKDLEKEK